MATSDKKEAPRVKVFSPEKYELDAWFKAIGSVPKEQKAEPEQSRIRGSKYQVQDVIARLRDAAHQVKNRHPRAQGKMFIDEGNNLGEAERSGVGRPPSQGGSSDNWYYPGGYPPGYHLQPPLHFVEVFEEGTIW